MTRPQKCLLTLGLLLFAACGLYPPWVDNGYSQPQRVGWARLTAPPQGYRVEIDWARLGVLWAVTGVLTAGGVALAGKGREG